MFRALNSARRKSSHFALAIALASGGVVATAAVPATAAAQEEVEASSGFTTVLNQVVPLIQGESQDFPAAQAMIPQLTGAIENNRDREIAGRVLLAIGNGVDDRQLQRRGIAMRLESGLAEADQIGVLNWYAGNFALEVDDYAASRHYLTAALQAGYVPEQTDLVNLIARTYMEEGNDRGSYDFLTGAIAEADAAGNPVPEAWLRNTLQFVYEEDMLPETTANILRLIRDYPGERSWSDGLRIMGQMLDASDDARVDLYRLMAIKGALVDRPYMTDYIETIDPRLMANEVLDVLRIGLEQEAFSTSGDAYFDEVNGIANTRASADRRGIGQIISEGRNGDGLDAKNAGDVLYSLDDYAQAVEFYTLARDRGFDADTVNTLIGINETMLGNYDAALASFAAVGGERAPIAALWTAHVEELLVGS